MPTEADWFDALSAGVSAVLFVPVTLAVLLVAAVSGYLFAYPLLGADPAGLAAVLGTLALAGAAVALDTPAGWPARLRVATYALAIAVLGIALLAAIWAVVVIAVVLVVGAAAAVVVASVLALTLWCALAVGVLLAVRDTGSPIDWSLTLRMVAAVLLLALLTVGFLAATWVFVWFASLIAVVATSADAGAQLGVRTQVGLATLLSLAALGAFVYVQIRHVATVERHARAVPVPTEEAPGYYALTARVAMQLDVPMPTLAHSPSEAPEAMVVGFRPHESHLVLSDGTTRPLGDDELAAVMAHELAHVANRDAMVTTAVSVPVVLATAVHEWACDDDGSRSVWSVALLPLTGPPRLIGRLAVALVSRTRETAADRTAAETLHSPAALASALRTLDERIRAAPESDLRRAAAVSSLSILPLERRETDRDGLLARLRAPFVRLHRRCFRTHPPTERRLEDLEQFLEERD